MLLEILIGSLAAIGLVCVLWAVYDIALAGAAGARACAELYLYLDGHAPGAERLLRAANRARRVFLPGMPVVFIEAGEECAPLRQLAEELDIEYFIM